MKAPEDVVFLFDCDNTLLDNDSMVVDLRVHLESEFGQENRDQYFEIFEALRKELGYADYLGALQRYRLGGMNDPRLLQMSSYLVDYPFSDRLYAGALDVIEHLGTLGSSDQDCGRRSAVESLFIFIRSECSMTSNNATRPATTSWWMTSCVS